MNTNGKPWVSRRRMILGLIGIPVLVGAWWAFRPEKLFINQKVSEVAPLRTESEPQPIYTGKLEGKVHATSGRATIYESTEGKRYLRLSDFATSNGPDVHVLLARAEDKALEQEIVKGNLDGLELGSLKGNQGDQNYDLPGTADLQQYQAVVIYCERFHAVFGVAKLEKSEPVKEKDLTPDRVGVNAGHREEEFGERLYQRRKFGARRGAATRKRLC